MIRIVLTLSLVIGCLNIQSCVNGKASHVTNIIEVEYTKSRTLDRNLFNDLYKNSNKDEKEFNWKRLKKKEFFKLWIGENESNYKKILGLNSRNQISTTSGTISYSEHETELYRNLAQDFTLLSTSGKDFIIKDSIQPVNWKIDYALVKDILGYKCYQATSIGYEKNSKLIAWFSPSLPKNFGPYFYGGLPGLILEVEVAYSDDPINNSLNVISGSLLQATSIKKGNSRRLTSPITKEKRVISREERNDEIKIQQIRERQYNSSIDNLK